MSKAWYEKDDDIGCGLIILIVIGLIALLFLGPAITMWLWNWIAVSLFNAPVIGKRLPGHLKKLLHILFGRTVTIRSGK